MLVLFQILTLFAWFTAAVPLSAYNETTPYTGNATADWLSPDYYPSPQGGRIKGVWQDAYVKAKAIVGQMTIVEKVNLTTAIGWQFGNCVGNTGSVPRFGIPNLCFQDGPLGVRFSDFITAFPSGMGAASSFNRDLIYARGEALGYQFKQKGIHVSLGPVVGPVGLKAQGGRNFEGFGADPYLAGQAAAHSIKGLQSQKVMACIKHYIGNEQERYRQPGDTNPFTGEITKESVSSDIPDRAMHEVYLRPFADAVHAGVGTVMCAYQKVNHTYSCENSYVLNYLLKEELGFQGFVTSDWGAQMSGVKSALAGLDVTMPGETNNEWDSGYSFWGANLTKAVYNQTVPLERLDDMATRVLAAFFATNSFPKATDLPNFSSWTKKTYGNEFILDKTSPIVKLNHHVDPASEFTQKVALNSAEEGVVLLKNTNKTLPISSDKVRKLLVAGIAAGPDPLGFAYADQGSADGALFQGWGSGSVDPRYEVTPFEAIGYHARKNRMQFDYVRESIDQSQKIAADSDIAIVVVSSDSGEGYITVDKNEGDRNNVTLWHNGDLLIEAVAANCSNTIVVVTSTGPVDFERFVDHKNVTAILWAAPLGQEAGTAIANVLFGKTNPSGHLPFTIAKDVSDYVPIDFENQVSDDTFAETDLLIDYRYFNEKNITPRYPFGYGLSYNEVKYSGLEANIVNNINDELPAPEAYLAEWSYNDADSLKSPEDAYWKENARRVNLVIYPYLEPNVTLSDGNYIYPYGYSTEQRPAPIRAGGGLGGNDALWQKVIEVKVNVQNLGDTADKFVPQLYIKFPESEGLHNPIELHGFEKVSVAPKQTECVTFDVLLRDIAVWDTTQQSWIVKHGTYEFYLGTDASTYVLSTTLSI